MKKIWWLLIGLISLVLIVALALYLLTPNPQQACNRLCGYGVCEKFEETCLGNPTCIYDLCVHYFGTGERFVPPDCCCLCIT